MNYFKSLFFVALFTISIDAICQGPNRELLEMIKAQDIAKLEAFIKANPQEINKEISSYGYPLFLAIDQKKYTSAMTILSAGGSAGVKNEHNENALHRITTNKNFSKTEVDAIIPLIELLKKKGIDFNQYSESGYTPLHLLVRHTTSISSVENAKIIAEALIANGANPKLEIKNKNKIPLINEVISAMQKGETNKEGKVSIREEGGFEMIKVLIEKGYNPNAQDAEKNNALIILIKKTLPEEKKIEMARYLLEKKVNPKQKNKKGESALELTEKNTELYGLLKKGLK